MHVMSGDGFAFQYMAVKPDHVVLFEWFIPSEAWFFLVQI